MLTSVYYLGSTVYYLGSFNPPTRGHLSAVQEVRKAFPAVKVLVHADDEVSVWKPNRIAWEIRTAMLEILFKDAENVTVVKKTRKEIQSVLKSAYIINLVGSDSWQFYKERDFVNEIVTIMREGDNFKIPVGVPHVTLLKPSIANLSSTFVRQNLSPEYLGKPLYDFIKRNLLYVQNRLPDILNGLGPEAQVFNRSGKSGDIILFQPPNRIVKAFLYKGGSLQDPDPLRRSDNNTILRLEKEVAGITFLSQNIFEHIRVPTLHSVVKFEFWGYTVSECLKEKDIVNTYDRIMKCYTAGKALKELHSYKQFPPENLEAWVKRLDVKFESFNPTSKEREQYIDARNRYLENPGPSTYVHGDANLGNFIIEDEKVYFLDLISFGIRYPAYEYFQFLNCIDYQLPKYIAPLSKDNFKFGYGKHAFTEEAFRYYQIYWSLKVKES